MRRTFSLVIIVIMFVSSLMVVFNIQQVKASPGIIIRSDGSVSPTTPLITTSDNITYSLTGNVSDNIGIQRDNIVLDGRGYILQGPYYSGNGIEIYGSYGGANVTIRNLQIRGFVMGIKLWQWPSGTRVVNNTITDNNDTGVYINRGSDIQITDNNISSNTNGVQLSFMCDNTNLSRNSMKSNRSGILVLASSTYNSISGNSLEDSFYGIYVDSDSNNNNIDDNSMSGNQGFNSTAIVCVSSDHTNIRGNNITLDVNGIVLTSSSYNVIIGNNIADNDWDGIILDQSANNTFYGNSISGNGQYCFYLVSSLDNFFQSNNFIANPLLCYMYSSYPNFWDNGYPSGGNFWSTNAGAATDHFRGVYQNESGIDGIADSPYTFSPNETDHYPLMGPFGPLTPTGTDVTVFPIGGVGLTFASVTVAGSTNAIEYLTGPMPPLGWSQTGSFYDITTTAGYSGNTMIRVIYNDTGMTSEQEMNLRIERWNATTASLYDVNGDWKEDVRDVFKVAKAFGTTIGGPNPPGRIYDPKCDFNNDGAVDVKDYYKVCQYYGKPTGTWVNITTYIDTTSNVIYGETSHFSGIGVHNIQT